MPLTPLGRARFRIYPQGVQAERLEYDEKMLQLSTQKQSIVKALEHFETDDACRILDTSRKRENTLIALGKLEHDSRDFSYVNSYFLEEGWLGNTLDRIRKQQELLAVERR